MTSIQKNGLIWLVLGIAMSVVAYSFGLPGDYAFDDNVNLFSNPRFIFRDYDLDNIIRAMFSSGSGPLGRPISMLSFALNQYFSRGLEPLSYKLTNLVVHEINALLVFLCFRLVLCLKKVDFELSDDQCQWVAGAVAAIWAAHPLNLTSVLYIVQRMTSLSATFLLIGILLYLVFRQREIVGDLRSRWYLIVLAFVSFLLSVFSKESGFLFFAYLGVIEVVLLQFKTKGEGRSGTAIWIGGVCAFVPIVIGATIILINPGLFAKGYDGRPFSMVERLLSESRIIWFYISLILWPDIRQMALFHDDIHKSIGLMQPLSTVFSIIAIVCLLGACWGCFKYSKKWGRVLSFGGLWFLVGHLVESTVIPLELIFEHRNYLPMLGLIFIVVVGVANIRNRSRWAGENLVVAVILLSCTVATAYRAKQWENITDQALAEAMNHPGSTRANYQLGRVFSQWYSTSRDEKYAEMAEKSFSKAIEVDWEGRNGGYFGLIHFSFQRGKYPDSVVIETLASRLEHSVSIGVDIAFLTTLAKCQINEYCWLNDRDFLKIADGYLKNALVTPAYRANVYSTLGVYYYNKKKDAMRARYYFEQAASLSSTVDRLLDLAEFYRIEGQYGFAEDAVSKAREAIDADKMAVDIDRTAMLIEKTRQNSLGEAVMVR